MTELSLVTMPPPVAEPSLVMKLLLVVDLSLVMMLPPAAALIARRYHQTNKPQGKT
ncbi:MAG: hypothetical protein NC092_07915 [Butyrivibrio sp.]|nr:hypothetical protein [Muribaculum sp.]MCM1552600.1 hypothetical protein [Butyrivibrio sp.]